MTEERRQVLEQEREAAAAAHDEARLAAVVSGCVYKGAKVTVGMDDHARISMASRRGWLRSINREYSRCFCTEKGYLWQQR